MSTTSAGSQPECTSTGPPSGLLTPDAAKRSLPTKYLQRIANSKTLRKLCGQSAGTVEPLKVILDLVDCIVNPEDVLNGKQEYEALKAELDKTIDMLTQYDDGTASPTITTTVERLCEDIKQELQSLGQKINKDGLGRLRKESGDLEEVLKCYDYIRDRLQRLSLNIDLSIWKALDITTTNNLLDRLQPAMSACYNSRQTIELKRVPCTEGTRNQVLSQMNHWVGTSDPGSVYWMSGMAGTGKTTISYSLCKQLEASGRLAASFFCTRQLPECRDVGRIIPSLAYQLARFSHPFRFALSDILKKNPDAHTRELQLQFDALIVKPLTSLKDSLPGHPSVKDTLPDNLVVLIDALDECESKKSTSRILSLLLTKSANLPIKFIVSSRPESEIHDQMANQDDQARSRMVLHELDRQLVQADIETYLRSALAQMQLSEDEMKVLVERAGVLFIHAATLVRYISHDNFRGSRARLENILNTSASAGKQHKDIDELYTAVLRGALDNPDLEGKEKEDIRQVLHTVICAKEPLTVDALSSLLKMNDANQVQNALRPLWSVLHISGSNELVTTLHASFPEYMLDPSRSKEHHWDPRSHHQTLTLRCFDCFRDVKPQFNICRLKSSCVPDKKVAGLKDRVDQAITTELFYAARYWAGHLQSAIGSPELIQELEEFLSTRLLLWMEVMNLKKCKNAMSEAIQLAERCNLNYSGPLSELIWDACWFTRVFAINSISESTPHIYTSLLPLWPKSSLISKKYSRWTQGSITADGTATVQRQTSLLATWYLGGKVHTPTFSPDGSQIAVGVDHTIVLLNVPTGQRVIPPLIGHTDMVRSVQFSPDGAWIVSGSNDMAIRVWSTQNGEAVLGPLKRHTTAVMSVDCSPDGFQIVSGSYDGTICTWDARSGELLFSWSGMQEHLIRVEYLSDGRNIVSIGMSPGIVVWDAKPGQKPKAFRQSLFEDMVSSGDISPDGTRIAFGSDDENIYVWDIQTGQVVLGPLRNPYRTRFSYVTSISFSHNGALIASVFRDGALCVWDAQTGDLIFDLLEDIDRIVSINFSPDDAYIVSASFDKALRLWDTRSMRMVPKLVPGYMHAGPAHTISFSSDGTRIVSGSGNGTVNIWSVESGDSAASIPKEVFARVEWSTCEGAYKEEYPDILRVGFSPDSARILVNTTHGPFVFDAKTERLCNLYADYIPPSNFPYLIVTLSFVSLAVSFIGPPLGWKPGFDSTTTSPWLSHIYVILARGFELAINGLKLDLGLRAPASAFSALIFQASFILVTGVRIFGDSVFGTIDIHSPHISCADFSSDGTRVISGSADGVIRVHNAHTNRLMLVIRLPAIDERSPHLVSVAFSPDCERIISTSRGRRPQIHCARSGKLLSDLNDDKQKNMFGLSPDGTRVVTKNEETISLINLGTRESVVLNPLTITGEEETLFIMSIQSGFTFAADGSSIAFISKNNSIYIWNAHTGELLHRPIKLSVSNVVSIAYSPDGRYVVTGSKDGTICMTNIQSKRETAMDDSPTSLDWEIHEDGWTVDNQSRLLVWVPPELRPNLMWPRTQSLISRRGSLKLDFENANLGENWAQCYQPK